MTLPLVAATMSHLSLYLLLSTVVRISHLASGNTFTNVTKRSDVSTLVSLYSNPIDIKATYYGEYPGDGACALDPLPALATQPGWIRGAAAEGFVQGSLGCGMCLEITGEGKGSGNDPITGPIKASVHDSCHAGVDLYIVGDGIWDVKAKAINCPTVPGSNGKIKFRFTGSNPWSFKLQARNTKVPTKSMEIFGKGKWNVLRRTSDNYFNNGGVKLGKINFPIKIRVTSIFGESLETTIPRILNDKDTPSQIQYTGFGGSSGGAGEGNGGRTTPKPTGRPVTTASKPNPDGGSKPGGGAGSGGKGHFCEGKAPGMYADPTDCTYFYKCANGTGERIACARGLQFNPKTMNCDWPKNVDCKAKTN